MMRWWADDRHLGRCVHLPTGAIDSHHLPMLIQSSGPELCFCALVVGIGWYHTLGFGHVPCREKLLLSSFWRIMGIKKHLQHFQFELEKFCACNLCYLLYSYPSLAIWGIFVSKHFHVCNRSLFHVCNTCLHVVVNHLCPWALLGVKKLK